MGFIHAQPSVDGSVGTGATSLTLTLGSLPSPGDLTIVAFMLYDLSALPTLVSVKDANGHAYTLTPLSPLSVATLGAFYIAYLIQPASNNSAAVTITFSPALSSNGVVAGFIDDFSVAGGFARFDRDATATATSSGTTTGPTITPNNPNSLLYTYGAPATHYTGVSSPWVSNTIGEGANGDWAAWILSDSSAQTSQFAISGSSELWGNIVAAFYLADPTYSVEDYGQVFGR
jgi:hypothetical protein